MPGTPSASRSRSPIGSRTVTRLCRVALPVAGVALLALSLPGLMPARAADTTGVAGVGTAATAGRVVAAGAARSTARPGADNTGVPAGTRLRRHDGDLYLTRRGAHVDSLDVRGFVFVEAADVTISRSIVRGRASRHNIGLVNVTDRLARNFVLQDSALVPTTPSVRVDGIQGRGYTVRRTEIRGTVDGAKVFGADVRIEASWIHDMRWFRHDPSQSGRPTHNDGVQVLGGSHIRLVGNTISGADNAGLQVTQDYSATTDLVFRDNWADGGGCTVNLANAGRSRLAGMTVEGNRFGRHTRIRNCPVLATRRTAVQTRGNVWDDTGEAVRIRRNG